MKQRLLTLFCAFAGLLFWGCGSRQPETPSAPVSVNGKTDLEPGLMDIAPNYEIQRLGAEVGGWTTDYSAAMKLAAEKKVPVLLNFSGSDWCKYCKLLIRDVFSQKEWQDWVAGKFILVSLDFPRNQELISEDLLKQNSELREKFQVEAFPTLLVLEDDGTPLGIVEMREDNSVLTVKRNLKAIIRRRQSVIRAMISRLPDDKRPEIQGLYDKIQQDKQKLTDLAKQHEETMNQLQKGLMEMSEKTENAILDSLVQQRPAELQQKYAEAKKQMEELNQQLNTWLANSPEQNDKNMLLYKNFQRQLQEQSDIIADIIDPD